MGDGNPLQDRGRSLEEEYFRRKNRELIEKMQHDERSEQARRDMGAQVGIDDPEMLRELQKLGFTAETVALLPLVPVGDAAAARQTADRVALRSGDAAVGPGHLDDGGAAYHQLEAWLGDRPAPEVFSGATRLIRAILDSPAHDRQTMSADDLVAYCESIASASGGLFGVRAISPEERAALASIAARLKKG